MCGIFGIITGTTFKEPVKTIAKATDRLFQLSESRGKEAAGLAVKKGRTVYIYKEPVSANQLIKKQGYRNLFSTLSNKDTDMQSIGLPLALIGHSRLATDGHQLIKENNQPVVYRNVICVHNGIITNSDALWKRFPDIQRKSDVDTEILAGLLHFHMSQGKDIREALLATFSVIEGSASMAALMNAPQLVLATNTGSLYFCQGKSGQTLVFASERYILEQFYKNAKHKKAFKKGDILHLPAWSGAVIDINRSKIDQFLLSSETQASSAITRRFHNNKSIEIIDLPSASRRVSTPLFPKDGLHPSTKRAMQEVWETVYTRVDLKRCTKCILPETFPFIRFDAQGVCNYCRNHRMHREKGREALEKRVAPYRKKGDAYDCLVSLSGGRDSTYALHYIKQVLKMNPVAYTYDWGVLTDLGRRNQARICGKLGIEHIIISADISRKRRFVKKNLAAWLRKPDIGMVPILMAGDKQLLYYFYKLAKEMHLELLIQSSAGVLENSLFKMGFAGVPLQTSATNHQNIKWRSKLALLWFYGKNYLTNPRYINSSIFDTLHAYYSNMLIPENYILLYDYIKWDEERIVTTLVDEYNWEMEKNTKTTWRIDDGTTAFYNYIYLTVVGFTEHDTFRSNQIRQGMLSRETALKQVAEENAPRYDSIEWYARIIGFDPDVAIQRIHQIERHY